MGQIQHSFRRYEKKFVLTKEQYEQVLQELLPCFRPDEYGAYTICNIYYDTDTYASIRNSIEKPVYKEKFRLRSYGVPDQDGCVFAELKKKYKGVVYKRRVEDTPAHIDAFLREGMILADNRQIQQEISWYLQTTGQKPKVFLAYDRTAYAGLEDPSLRLTFDRNLRYRTDRLNLMDGDDGKPILPEERIIMEVKVPEAFPMWMVDILSRNRLYTTGFSKYGTCYQQHLYKEQFHSTLNLKGDFDYVKQYSDNTGNSFATDDMPCYGYGAWRCNGSRLSI